MYEVIDSEHGLLTQNLQGYCLEEI
jgi:hypothetical protein